MTNVLYIERQYYTQISFHIPNMFSSKSFFLGWRDRWLNSKVFSSPCYDIIFSPSCKSFHEEVQKSILSFPSGTHLIEVSN